MVKTTGPVQSILSAALFLALGQAARSTTERPWTLAEEEWVTPHGIFKLDFANVDCGVIETDIASFDCFSRVVTFPESVERDRRFQEHINPGSGTR